MSTNLIDNYIASKPVGADYTNDRSKAVGKIAPLAPRGKLVGNSPFDAPSLMVQGLAYDVKSLNRGLKGESNDHQLGKINDIGMKVGGLAIASYLFTKKAAPMAKSMEFVGFLSFFASMAIWPKLAIQLPSRVIHGFNVHQKYRDSQGRVKPFFQDPQYLPWDLYSDKQIDKIGDRLGVSRNIENRREVVQERMKKIAVQDNTLWMLTAGFATPIMSALICNALEQPIVNLQDKLNNKKADDMLKNPDKYAQKVDYSDYTEKLDNLLHLNKDQPITPKLIEQIADSLAPSVDPVTKKAVIEDLTSVLIKNKFTIDERAVQASIASLNAVLKDYLTPEELAQIVPDVANFTNFLEGKNAYKQILTDPQLFKLKTDIVKHIMKNGKDAELAPLKLKQLASVVSSVLSEPADKILGKPHPLDFNPLKASPADKITLAEIEKINKIAKIFQNYGKKAAVFKNYAHAKVADSPEVALANQWNKISAKLLSILGITKDEVRDIRLDRLFTSKLLRKKIEYIIADDARYEKAINELVSLVHGIDFKVKPEDIAKYHEAVSNLHFDTSCELYDEGLTNTSKKFNSLISKLSSLNKTLEKFVNKPHTYPEMQAAEEDLKRWGLTYDEARNIMDSLKNTELSAPERRAIEKKLSGLYEENIGSLDRAMNTFFDARVAGVKNSFYRLINSLDIYRRTAKGNFGVSLPDTMRIEEREEAIEHALKLTLGGHASDYSTKGYSRRNPNPNPSVGPLIIENGKIKNQFHGVSKGVDMPWDSMFFKNWMRFMYANRTDDRCMHIHNFDDVTQKILEKHSMLDQMTSFVKDFYQKVGGYYYFQKPQHKTVDNIKAGDDVIFDFVGLANDKLINNIAKQTHNSRAWLKMFTKFGAGLLGVTLLVQFLFGSNGSEEVVKVKK